MVIQGDLAQILTGIPIQIPGCNIAVSQPSVKEICAFGETDFLYGLQILTKTDKVVESIKKGNSQLAMLSDFQILIATAEQDSFLKCSLEQIFELLFPNYMIEFAIGCINFRVEQNGTIVGQINPMNFESFQKTLDTLFLPHLNDNQVEEYNPANGLAAEIAAKLKRGQEQRAKIKQKASGENNSIFATYISVLSVGLSMDINVLYEYTPFQLFDVFKRYMLKVAYDLHMKIVTTPFMDTSKMEDPKNWLDNLYN